MACLGIRHSGVGDCMILKRGGGYTDERSNRLSGFTQLSIPNLAVKIPNHRVSTAVYATLACDSGHRSTLSLFDDGLDLRTEPFGGSDDNEDHDRTCIESPRASEKLDEWMRISVTEIVKNIKQAPLLVQIYADGEVEMKKSPAAKDWRNVVKHRSSSRWVIFMIRFKLKSSYMEDKDNFAMYYVAVPCAILALLIHPSTSHHIVNRIFWAFCVYLEAVSVLPQLRVMQNTKIVEPFTAHYVFALGVARFLSCAHWVLQVLDSRGHLLTALGYGLWPSMVLISEIVQTFILADFCYYYIKSVFGGQLVLRLPSGVV